MRLLARSDASAWRAEETAQTEARKLDGGTPDRIKVTTEPADLADCDLVVEAIVEDAEPKVELLTALGEACPDADLASTTSSLSLEASRPQRPRTPLLRPPRLQPGDEDGAGRALPAGRRPRGRSRARPRLVRRRSARPPIEVPDQAGFVVNRLLFPLPVRGRAADRARPA